MLKVNLEQGSAEWLNYRFKRIGASDFPVIASLCKMVDNIFKKTERTFLNEKCNVQESKSNFIFDRGHKFESIILSEYRAISLVRGEVFEYDGDSRIYASLDGRDDVLNLPIEVKTTQKSKDKIQGLIEYYSYQVAHQCYVVGSETGILVIRVLDSNSNFIEQIEHEVFASDVISKELWLGLCGQYLKKIDGFSIVNSKADTIAKRIKSYTEKIKELEQKVDEYKVKLIEMYPDGVVNNKFSITKEQKTTYKYSQFVKDNNYSISDNYKTVSDYYKFNFGDDK